MPASSLLVIALLGILSSVVTELVTWLNRKLSGSVLKGEGALLLSILAAFGAGIAHTYVTGIPLHEAWNVTSLIAVSTEAFGYSQLYFQTIAKWLDLKVDHGRPTPPPLA
jgi:hypothetical protein